MKTALAFAGSRFDFNLFSRLKNGLNAKGFSLMLLTCKPSLWLHSRLNGIMCILVKNSENAISDIQIISTTEVMTNSVGEQEAARFYHGVWENLEKIHSTNRISLVLIWNGNSVPTRAISVFALQHNISALYFELANIPGKLFVDPRGVNAQSLLFYEPDILKHYSIESRQYKEWRETYLEYKRRERATPLALRSRSIANMLFPLDSIATSFFDVPAIGEMSILGKVKNLRQNPVARFPFDRYNIGEGKYNFFPMQVSDDSQLVFNSPVTLQEAVTYAYDRSKEQGRDLLIKPHPVDEKKEIAEYLFSLRGKQGLYVVNEPTFSIVEQCQEVITINSTVGLEGLIAKKKVTFLGKSYYASMNEERLKQYLFGYLVDVDYFSKKDVPDNQVEKILSHLLLQ